MHLEEFYDLISLNLKTIFCWAVERKEEKHVDSPRNAAADCGNYVLCIRKEKFTCSKIMDRSFVRWCRVRQMEYFCVFWFVFCQFLSIKIFLQLIIYFFMAKRRFCEKFLEPLSNTTVRHFKVDARKIQNVQRNKEMLNWKFPFNWSSLKGCFFLLLF